MGQKAVLVKSIRFAAILAVCVSSILPSIVRAGHWTNLVSDAFDGSTSAQWSYSGVNNASGDPMFRYDATSGVLRGEWDEANYIDVWADPLVVSNSSMSRSLPRTLNDGDTFRVRVTLQVEPGSVPDTSEFFGIGNVGVYNLTEMGPDRSMTDNWPTNLVKDGSDFVEFNYWINNNYGGPNIGAMMGAHLATNIVDGDYWTGTDYTQTTLGDHNLLPAGSNLYVELTYFGADSGPFARRCCARIFADALRSKPLVITNSTTGLPKAMTYWTQALPVDKHFTATDVAFINYPQGNWGGVNGAGRGTFDDLAVDVYDPETDFRGYDADPAGPIVRWVAVSGATYRVMQCSNLIQGAWTTSAVVVAQSPLAAWTNGAPSAQQFFKIVRP